MRQPDSHWALTTYIIISFSPRSLTETATVATQRPLELPPRPDTQLSLEPAEEGQQAISLDDICRLPRILRAQHAFTHTHTHTHVHTKKQKKNEHAPGSTSATLCGSGSRRFRQQAPVIKSSSQRKETTKTKKKKRKERASTCSEVTRHPGWPRVTWYGMPSHLVPLSQSWGVTIGTCFLKENKRKKQKERSTNKKKQLIANRPRQRQATKKACHPDQGRKKTQQNTLPSTQRAPRSGRGGAYRPTDPPQS